MIIDDAAAPVFDVTVASAAVAAAVLAVPADHVYPTDAAAAAVFDVTATSAAAANDVASIFYFGVWGFNPFLYFQGFWLLIIDAGAVAIFYIRSLLLLLPLFCFCACSCCFC